MKQTLTAILIFMGFNSYAQTGKFSKDSLVKYGSSLTTDLKLITIARQPVLPYIVFEQNYSIVINDGGVMVAYKKKDSSWVLINPDKTRMVLDSVITNYKRKQ
jgi:hypothetical protein